MSDNIVDTINLPDVLPHNWDDMPRNERFLWWLEFSMARAYAQADRGEWAGVTIIEGWRDD